jgi:hypothetical protein
VAGLDHRELGRVHWRERRLPGQHPHHFMRGEVADRTDRSSELYDIDRPINRTLVYGLLTALLAGVYAGAVLVLGQVFGGVTDDPPSWAVAGATLAVAALFQPARRRIQTVVDRRFNRRKYNAARTVELFAVRLRNEVDLDTLSAELLGVVDQTMQPTRSSLWLRPTSPASRRTAGWNRVNVWSYGAAM